MKTPEQMAEEYLDQDKVACDAINHAAEDLVRAAFLAGYDAGYENCLKTIGDLTEHLEKQLIEEMYVNIEPLLKEKK